MVDLLRRRGRTGSKARIPAPAAFLAAVALLAAACAGGEAPPPERAPPAVEAEDGDAEEADEEEARIRALDPGAGTPRRAASEEIRQRGAELRREGRADEAASLLQRAIRVDPSNGRAYLELARVRTEEGRREEARGLLERAAELLRAYPEDAARVDSLRKELDPDG